MEILISIRDFCSSHNIEISFISLLEQNQLIEVTKIEQSEYIPVNELQKLERLVRLHYELDINLEGIETVLHLLSRIDTMQGEIRMLKNRLRLYENGFQ
jgi:chaperone modulatory protein CbpM